MLDKYLSESVSSDLDAILDELGECEERVKSELISQAVRVGLSEVWNLTPDLNSCESPIEQILLIHIATYDNFFAQKLTITPQWELKLKDRTYRTDILVTHHGKNGSRTSIAIECDGHDFHEKTKAQAAKDKSRDRAFQIAGIPILHFTGSEIWADPAECASQVLDLICKTKNGGA